MPPPEMPPPEMLPPEMLPPEMPPPEMPPPEMPPPEMPPRKCPPGNPRVGRASRMATLLFTTPQKCPHLLTRLTPQLRGMSTDYILIRLGVSKMVSIRRPHPGENATLGDRQRLPCSCRPSFTGPACFIPFRCSSPPGVFYPTTPMIDHAALRKRVRRLEELSRGLGIEEERLRTCSSPHLGRRAGWVLRRAS